MPIMNRGVALSVSVAARSPYQSEAMAMIKYHLLSSRAQTHATYTPMLREILNDFCLQIF